MNFFNRAIKNISRRLTKTILLLITFFVIGNFVILGLAINTASENAKTATRKQITTVVSLQFDYQKFYEYVDTLTAEEQDEAYTNMPRLTIDQLKAVSQDKRVVGISALDSLQAYPTEGIDNIKLPTSDSNSSEPAQNCWIDENGIEQCDTYVEPPYMIEANYFANPVEVQNGMYTVTSGTFYTQDDIDQMNDVILVTEEFANLNNLKVGDSFNLKLFDDTYFPKEDQNGEALSFDSEVEFKIVGIYQPKLNTEDNLVYYSANQLPGNKFLIPGTTLANINFKLNQQIMKAYPQDPTTEEMTIDDFIYLNSVVFSLDDPESAASFIADQQASLGDYYLLNANLDTYNKLIKPLSTIGIFSNFVVIFIVINAIIIITLITAITLKNREYEIGILLSLGTSKLKVIGQFFVELVIIGFIGFTLAVITGSISANKIGETIWSYQANYEGITELDSSSLTDSNTGWDIGYYSGGITDYDSGVTYEDVANNYAVAVSPLIILEIYLAGFLIIFVAIIIPSSMIMRFPPKKILSGIK